MVVPNVMNVKRVCSLFSVVVFILLGFQMSLAQRIFPIRGGTRIETDARDKKERVIVAENPDIRITIGKADKFRPAKGQIWVFWMKIENLSDKTVKFDPNKFTGVDDEGRAVSGLESEVAIQRFSDAVAGVMNMMGNVLAGPLAGPGMVKASERGGSQKLNQESIQLGDIPPKTFKDGMVFLEKSKAKTNEVKVSFVGLWIEPIIFTTNDGQRLKADK